VLLGSGNSAGTLRIREFLSRNGHPYSYVDLDNDTGAQRSIGQFQVTAAEVPVVICRGKTVLRNPTNRQVADCLGFNEGIDQQEMRDVIIDQTRVDAKSVDHCPGGTGQCHGDERCWTKPRADCGDVGCSIRAADTSSKARYLLWAGATPTSSSGMCIRLAPTGPIENDNEYVSREI
jgi:hypothetical protein